MDSMVSSHKGVQRQVELPRASSSSTAFLYLDGDGVLAYRMDSAMLGSENSVKLGPEQWLQAMYQEYQAVGNGVRMYIQQFAQLGSFSLFAIGSLLTLSINAQLTLIQIIIPLTILTLSFWVINHVHLLSYGAAYLEIIEMRINNALPSSAIDWEHRWTPLKRKSSTNKDAPLRLQRIAAHLGGTDVPIIVLGILLVIWLLATFGYSLYAGWQAMEAWLRTNGRSDLVLTAMLSYFSFHVILAIVALYSWFFWAGRDIKKAKELWMIEYKLANSYGSHHVETIQEDMGASLGIRKVARLPALHPPSWLQRVRRWRRGKRPG
jgi:hypothetical protein